MAASASNPLHLIIKFTLQRLSTPEIDYLEKRNRNLRGKVFKITIIQTGHAK